MFQGEHHRVYRTELAEALGVQLFEERAHQRAHPNAASPRCPLVNGVNPSDDQIRICFREPASLVPGFQRHPLQLTPAARVVHRVFRRTILPQSGYGEALTAPQWWLLSYVFHQTPFDLVDLLFLDRAGFPPERDLAAALKKDAGIDPSVLAWLLGQFPVSPMPIMPVPLEEEELQSFRDRLRERFQQISLP